MVSKIYYPTYQEHFTLTSAVPMFLVIIPVFPATRLLLHRSNIPNMRWKATVIVRLFQYMGQNCSSVPA